MSTFFALLDLTTPLFVLIGAALAAPTKRLY